MHLFEIKIVIFNFFMSPTCLGRWSYIQVLYSVFYMRQYRQSRRQKNVLEQIKAQKKIKN